MVERVVVVAVGDWMGFVIVRVEAVVAVEFVGLVAAEDGRVVDWNCVYVCGEVVCNKVCEDRDL